MQANTHIGTIYTFLPTELQYTFIAALIHDWLVDLAELDNASYDSKTYGNLEAFRDDVYLMADAFKEVAEDRCTAEGPSLRAIKGLELFAYNFTSLWRSS